MLAASYRDWWAESSAFDKNLYYWFEYALLWHEIKKRYPQVPVLDIASEDLFRDTAGTAQRIAAFGGFSGAVQLRQAPRNERNPRGTLRFPIRDDWRSYTRHAQLMALSESMGYPMDEATVEKEVRRYQPPLSATNRALFALRWYHVRSYLGQRLNARYWRDRRQYRRLIRDYPQYRAQISS
jgi:hypothetical protein